MNSVPESSLSDTSLSRERESILNSSSSSSRGQNLSHREMESRGRGKEEDIHSLSLKEKFSRYYGIPYDHFSSDLTRNEFNFLVKYKDILDEMNSQRAFTLSYIMIFFSEVVSEKTVKRILKVLLKNQILSVYKWTGNAAATWGVNVYHSGNATEKDIQSCLIEYEAQDYIRYTKEKQRKALKEKSKKTPEELKLIWKEQAEAAQELKKEQQEANTCKRLLTQGVTCASQFQKKYWCEVCLSEESA